MKKMFRMAMLFLVLVIAGSGLVAFYSIFFGGRDVAVPGLSGMPVVDAVSMTEKMGLLVRIDKVESLQASGVVVSQWPDPGTRVAKGKIVILKVSKGGDRQPLPDVRGMEYGQAVTRLQESGFDVGDIVRIHSDDRPAGVIVAQSPASPAMVPSGRRIDLMVSLGPPRTGGRIAVPDVLERSEKIARQIIVQSGLNVGAVRYEYTYMTPAGMVMNMDPKPGKTLLPNGVVNLVVATGKKPEETPETLPNSPGGGDSTAAAPPGGIPAPTVYSPPAQIQPQVPAVAQKPSAPSPGDKVARIRYQVPPLAQPMALRIEIVDKNGSRVLLDKQATAGEYVSLDASYDGQSSVTIYLGGEFVWQDRYQ
ncbi:MAG: PASTA domain-containing protein [Thermovirgaceae bacterium]|nr:PASTA domain-containing protein [Thermovirgaceae bacterium]